MANTVYTPDGTMHVLLGSTTILSIIRAYCGNEIADWVEDLAKDVDPTNM